MLTREQGLAVFDFAQGRLLPDRLTRATHAQYVGYAQQMLEVLCAEPSLVNLAKDFAPRPPYRPTTKFENRGLKLGHRVRDLLFFRKAG